MKILLIHSYYQVRGGEDSVYENDKLMLEENGYDVESMSFYNTGHSLIKILQLPFNFFSCKKVERKLRKFQPDIVHIHNMHFAASPSIIRAIKHKNIPCIVNLHNFRLVCPSGTLFFKNNLYTKYNI